MVKSVKLQSKKLLIEDEIELLFEKVVTKFGTTHHAPEMISHDAATLIQKKEIHAAARMTEGPNIRSMTYENKVAPG